MTVMADDKAAEDLSTAPAPPRFWQPAEAQAELVDLGRILARLREKVERLSELHDQLQHLAAFWGKEADAVDHPDHERKAAMSKEWESLHRSVEVEVGRLRDRGIEVKDLDTGLVDFYARRQGEVVCLCWRRGEEGIRFWHTLAGGFRSRQPLTPDELRRGLDPVPGRSRAPPPPPGYH